MSNIHPTAIIEGDVNLGENVRIGPMCVIRGSVYIGAGTVLIGHCWLDGPLRLGEKNIIHPFARIGAPPQHIAHEWVDPSLNLPGIIIGSNNIFREHSTIHAPIKDLPTEIGDSNYFMASSHVGHDCILKNNIILGHGAALGGHCRVYDRVNISGLVGVHQFVQLGEGSMIGANSFVSKDVPPWCMAMTSRRISSLNKVGMRRAGMTSEQRLVCASVFNLLYGGFSLSIAMDEIAKIDSPIAAIFLSFLKRTVRGVTPGPRSQTR